MSDQAKDDFLKWLDRFARIPKELRLTIERHSFSSSEIVAMKRQVALSYRLKKEFLKGQGA